MRVLIVEDNNDTLATMAAMLRFEQYDVITAPDASVGLAMAKLEPPDVVLLDIGLPGMDGYQLAEALRRELAGRRLYIAAITGYGMDADKKRAADAGINVHLTKPAAPSTIIGVLKNFAALLQKG